ncbi:WD repeat-containing protein 19 [Pseudoscourfieldia marina]
MTDTSLLFTVPYEQTGGTGSGEGCIEFSPNGAYLAVAGCKPKVSLFDRTGELLHEVILDPSSASASDPSVDAQASTFVSSMAWDKNSDNLAIVPRSSQSVIIWSAVTRESFKLDGHLKSITWLQWATHAPVLACGTEKGNLLLYDVRKGRKTPVIGIHSREITCGAWSEDGILALGSVDKSVSLSTDAGDTIKQVRCKAPPHAMHFTSRASDGPSSQPRQKTLSVNVGQKSIYLLNPDASGPDSDVPVELAFLQKYGNIISHCSFGDGYSAIAFSSGQMVCISTASREISEEVHSAVYHRNGISDMQFCTALQRIVTCGSGEIRMLDASRPELVEMKDKNVDDAKHNFTQMRWTEDGQVLAVNTTTGEVKCYLASLPQIHSTYDTTLCHLTSLLEFSIVEMAHDPNPRSVTVEFEPAFCALGPYHLVSGMNAQAWFYARPSADSSLAGTMLDVREYVGTVQSIVLRGEMCAVLTEGRVTVHPVASAGGADSGATDTVVPDTTRPADVECIAASPSILVCGTATGSIMCYFMQTEGENEPPTVKLVNEFKHGNGPIRQLHTNVIGTRVLFEDGRGMVYLLNPVSDTCLPCPKFANKLDVALWDAADNAMFVLADNNEISLFVSRATSINGAFIKHIATMRRPAGSLPVLFRKGIVTCQSPGGLLHDVSFEEVRMLSEAEAQGTTMNERHESKLRAELSMLRHEDAWQTLQKIKMPNTLDSTVLKASLEALDVGTAIKVARRRGQAGLVMTLERLQYVEDRNLLAGHVCVLLLQDYQRAQELFLRSSQPWAALEMRKDLKHWEEALKLARQLGHGGVSEICCHYASMLEMRGETENAIAQYEAALQGSLDGGADAMVLSEEVRADVQQQCRGGMARCLIRMGDLRRGRQMALDEGSKMLYKDCAGILESQGQLGEAAELYERGGEIEKAAGIYIRTKNFDAAKPLMDMVGQSRLHGQFARAQEAAQKYEEAAVAYERAGDTGNVVRLYLGALSMAQKAFAVARQSRNPEAAALVARHCQSTGDHRDAVEFLCLAGMVDEAFELAESQNEMDAFASAMKASSAATSKNSQHLIAAAKFFEAQGEFVRAGDVLYGCGQLNGALKMYLKKGVSAMDKAIQVVGEARNDSLTTMLCDFLAGEADGAPKGNNYLFKLHLALGDYEQAAHTAVLIAGQEREMGNYKQARDQLLDVAKELESRNIRIPNELVRSLQLLHSYILVKTLVKSNNHVGAARMLCRVAKSISKFPQHIVPILTSTVIECQRAELKRSAQDYAAVLMRPEHRDLIADAYRKKIEALVRRPDKTAEDVDDEIIPCAHCGVDGPAHDLECMACREMLPMCIATGKRMHPDQWSRCPSCHFPCLQTEMVQHLAAYKKCPLCSESIPIAAVVKMPNQLAK